MIFLNPCKKNLLQKGARRAMEAGPAASLLSSSSSFATQFAPSASASTSSASSSPSPSPSASSSSTSSSAAAAIPSLSCSLPSRTSPSLSASNSTGHPSRGHCSPIMAASDAAASSTCSSSHHRAASAIDFLMLCQRLKTTKRTGWVNHGLKETESIADHMYRMAVMAIISADLPGVNKDRCVKMAVIHDIAEAIVGDITPSDGIPKEEKSRRERAAIDEMCNLLGGGVAADEVKELWLEYENNATLEANLVKDFDKVEMILQALEYETTQGKVLNDFYESTAGKFQTELGRTWAAEIISRREKFKQ